MKALRSLQEITFSSIALQSIKIFSLFSVVLKTEKYKKELEEEAEIIFWAFDRRANALVRTEQVLKIEVYINQEI